jgi:aldehyde dehydrogenase family 7 protein A1
MESTSELSYDDFPFLKDLGIEKENLGVFNGKKWTGNGARMASVNPGTGKV